MDRNHILGFVIIFGILMVWSVLSKPSDVELAKAKARRDSIALANAVVIDTIKREELAITPIVSSADDDTSKIEIKEEILSLENDFVKIDFSNRGAKIVSATLKNHFRSNKKNDGEEIVILNSEKNAFELQASAKGVNINTGNLLFVPVQSGNKITFTASINGTTNIEYLYELKDDYSLAFVVNHNLFLDANPRIRWYDVVPQLERSEINEQRLSTVYYKESSEKSIDYCSCTSDDNDNLEAKPLDWISHSNQFFNASLIAKNFKFQGGDFTTQMVDIKTSQTDLKILTSLINLPKDLSKYEMEFYIGPNEFSRLQAYDNGLEQIIPFGISIFGTINRYVVRPAFDFLSGFINSKGIVIIILIFIIKMLLYPLLYKMLYGQAKMAALKPEIDKMKEKNKDDVQKQQMESMKLYQEYGVSPLSGCLPMLLQMPIWIALYRFFPASITFRKEPFLWADDLSTYDNIANLPFEIPFFGAHISLFTVLWAISTVIYTYYSTKNVDMSANPAMKYVQYVMPIMFLGFFNSYASGLTAYMFFSNLINILQIIVTKNFIFDNDKIRKELEIAKSKPKKKSAFQSRLEDAMKQQQEVAAKRNKG
jgi:YidC/Oxa1 family membrane protein insertase